MFTVTAKGTIMANNNECLLVRYEDRCSRRSMNPKYFK